MDKKILTKKQLELLGFIVNEKKLKTLTKVEITYRGNCSHYVNTFYDYPTFDEILRSFMHNVREEQKREAKQEIINRLFN